jgi:hypothetical protein
MRPLVESLCAFAGVLFVGAAACAADNPADIHARADKARSTTLASSHGVKCLGGILNENTVFDYLTLGDYPGQAVIRAGSPRIFICGDRIPSFIPWANYGERYGSHGH